MFSWQSFQKKEKAPVRTLPPLLRGRSRKRGMDEMNRSEDRVQRSGLLFTLAKVCHIKTSTNHNSKKTTKQ